MSPLVTLQLVMRQSKVEVLLPLVKALALALALA
jgi:hypothetical protein